jgi:hypothetical protein
VKDKGVGWRVVAGTSRSALGLRGWEDLGFRVCGLRLMLTGLAGASMSPFLRGGAPDAATGMASSGREIGLSSGSTTSVEQLASGYTNTHTHTHTHTNTRHEEGRLRSRRSLVRV